MKKFLFFGLFLVLMLLITSCTPKEVVCNRPYIQVGTECCLDSNDNKVCDSDEKELIQCNRPYIQVGLSCCLDKNENLICDNDEQSDSLTKKSSLPSKEITIDTCGYTEPIHFDCRYGFIWKDGIEFKLRMIEKGQYKIKKLVFKQVDCEIELPDDPQYILKFHDEVVFNVPCNISKESVEIDVNIIADYTSDSDNLYFTPTEVNMEQHIGGIVRDRYGPLDISNSLAEGLVTFDCEFSSDVFECTKHRILKDSIEIRLKSLSSSKIILKKIDFPFVPCSMNLTDEDLATMYSGDEKVFNVPCNMKREFAKSGIELSYDEYYSMKDGSGNRIEGKYEEKYQEKLLMGGWISGMIREN